MKKFYFTFGFGQRYQNCYHIIEAETAEAARDLMVRKFGKEWSMQYNEDEWFENGVSQAEKWNLKEIK